MGLQQRRGRVLSPTQVTLGATLLLGGLNATITPAFGQEAAEPRKIRVSSVELADAPFAAAIKMIRNKTGIDVAIIGDVRKYGHVTLSIVNQPIDDVLRLMATSAEADFWIDNGVFFFGPKGSAPKREEPLVPSILMPDVPSSGPMHYEKIFLKYTDPHIMLRNLDIDDGKSDYADIFKRNVMKTILDQSTLRSPMPAPIPTVSSNNTGNAPVTYVNNEGVPVAIPMVPTNSGGRSGSTGNGQRDQSSNRGNDTQESARGGQFGGGGFGGGGFGGAGGGAQGGGGGRAGGAQGGGGFAGGFLPDGLTAAQIRAYDADGSLLVQSNDDNAIQQLRALIRLLDVKPRQLMIKAEFVTVNQNDNSAFGLNWSFQRGNLLGGVAGGFSQNNTAFLQYAAGNVQAQLSFILSTDRGRIVASPMATTLNNVPVQFATQENIPFFQTTVINSAFGVPSTITQPNIIPATSSLSILPRINGDDTITLFGNVSISTQTGSVTGPDGSTFPQITSQSAPVQRIIRNGDTMVIGGFTRKNNTVRSIRVPLLSDLPLLGTLFRSRNVTVSESDLLVFITASILPERQTNVSLPGTGLGGGTAPFSPGGAGGGATP